MKDSDAFRRELGHAKETSVVHQLIRAARLLNEAGLRRVQQKHPRYRNVRFAHLTVFPHLDLEGTRLTDLARRMGVTKQAASQLVDDLERLTVVERQPDPDDRRAKRVVFTDEGRTWLLEGLSILRAVETEVLNGMPAANRKRLTEDLSWIIEALERLAAK